MGTTQIPGKQIKDASVDLAVDVTGVLPRANGGIPATFSAAGILRASTTTAAIDTVAAPTGTLVGTTDTQTLTNKDISTGSTYNAGAVTSSGTVQSAALNVTSSGMKARWTDTGVTETNRTTMTLAAISASPAGYSLYGSDSSGTYGTRTDYLTFMSGMVGVANSAPAKTLDVYGSMAAGTDSLGGSVPTGWAAYMRGRVGLVSGNNVFYLQAGTTYAEFSTYNYGTGGTVPMVFNANGGNFSLGNNTGTYGGGDGVVFLKNAGTVPTSNPTGGGLLYAQSGDIKWRTPGGTVSTLNGGGGGGSTTKWGTATIPDTESYVTVTFNTAFGSAPVVVISPRHSADTPDSQAASCLTDNVSSTSFDITRSGTDGDLLVDWSADVPNDP